LGRDRLISCPLGVWPPRCGISSALTSLVVGQPVPRKLFKKEERKWARLQLAIPVFIRSRDGNGKDSLEFATAINISPGGALVVVRRSLPKATVVSVEIPSAPIGPALGLKPSSSIMQAKAVWVAHLDDHHLLGLKFARPISTDGTALSGGHLRKAGSEV
jgi:hypothetical protein